MFLQRTGPNTGPLLPRRQSIQPVAASRLFLPAGVTHKHSNLALPPYKLPPRQSFPKQQLLCLFEMSSPNQNKQSPSSSSSASLARVKHIAAHMASPAATSFTAQVVPQAPEDPLFGLMAAYRADKDSNKVDLVCWPCPALPCPRLAFASMFMGASC